MIHTRMRHAHIGHGQQRCRTQRRNLTLHALTRRQGGAGKTRATHGFGEQGVGAVFLRLNNDVIGLGNTNAQLIHRHRLHVIAVGLHHRHLQTGQAHVEVGHGRRVDQTQAHPLTRLEQSGPVLLRALAVDQPGKALHILDVARHHAHIAPHQAVFQRGAKATLAAIAPEVAHRLLLAVVVVSRAFQVAHDAVARVRVLVGQLHHVFAVVAKRLAPLRLNDNRPVGAVRLLKTRMAVKPVGAGLLDREAIGEGLARRNTGVAQPRYAIHLIGQDQPVPVHRSRLVQIVGHVNSDVFAFAKAQNRAGRGAVITNALLAEIAGVDSHPVDGQAVFASPADQRQQRQRGGKSLTQHECLRPSRPDNGRARCRRTPGCRRWQRSRPDPPPAPVPAAGCWRGCAPWCDRRPCPSSCAHG